MSGVLICGSRDWSDAARIESVLDDLELRHLIVGDARGADLLAQTIGVRMGFDVTVYPADWGRHGKRAGILRNIAMLDAEPRLVTAFWDGKSPGTRFTITEARKRGIQVQIELPENPCPSR